MDKSNCFKKVISYNTPRNTFKLHIHTSFVVKASINFNYKSCSDLCQNGCKNYDKKYSCPPSSPSFEKLSKCYEYMVINAFKIPYDTLKTEYNSVRMANVVAKSLQRKIFDTTANNLKQQNVKHIIIENGSCRLCKICSYQKNEPCRHPEKMRFSLEATGVDVNDLVIKGFGFPLQWYRKGNKDKFPEYQCVVSGVLTNDPEAVTKALSSSLDVFADSLLD